MHLGPCAFVLEDDLSGTLIKARLDKLFNLRMNSRVSLELATCLQPMESPRLACIKPAQLRYAAVSSRAV